MLPQNRAEVKLGALEQHLSPLSKCQKFCNSRSAKLSCSKRKFSNACAYLSAIEHRGGRVTPVGLPAAGWSTNRNLSHADLCPGLPFQKILP